MPHVTASPNAAPWDRSRSRSPNRSRDWARAAPPALRISDAGIDQAVDDVDDGVDDDDDDEEHDERPLDLREIPGEHCVDEELADAGPAEDDLDDRGSG